jgi:hypothetical protein
MSAAAVQLVLCAEMARSGVENWISFEAAARALASRIIEGLA